MITRRRALGAEARSAEHGLQEVEGRDDASDLLLLDDEHAMHPGLDHLHRDVGDGLADVDRQIKLLKELKERRQRELNDDENGTPNGGSN